LRASKFRMRLFTAIDIPNDVQRNLRVLVDRLRPAARIAWSAVEKMHVTTKFIGEWPEERLEDMKATLQGVGSPGSDRDYGWGARLVSESEESARFSGLA